MDELPLESKSLICLLFGKQDYKKLRMVAPSSSFSADWLGNFNSVLIDEIPQNQIEVLYI